MPRALSLYLQPPGGAGVQSRPGARLLPHLPSTFFGDLPHPTPDLADGRAEIPFPDMLLTGQKGPCSAIESREAIFGLPLALPRRAIGARATPQAARAWGTRADRILADGPRR